jgi:hypothetical protein
VKITVLDNLKHNAGDVYEGALITEDGDSIGLHLESDGTYNDPVGLTTPRYFPDGHPKAGQPISVPKDHPQIQKWKDEGPKFPLKGPFPGDWVPADPGVEVDGYALSPALKGRRYRVESANSLNIEWPETP